MFSLRVKLVIAIGAIVSMASFPLIWMGYRDVYDHSIEAARKRFVSLSRMLEEDLRLSVLSEQSLVTQKISIEMDDIRSELDAIESWWRAGVLEKKDDVFTYMLEKWDTHTAVLRPDGTFVRTSPAVEALYGRNGADWLGVPFRTIVSDTDRNFQRDFRSFFRVRNERGEEKPYLTVFRKIDGVIAVVMQNVDYLEVSPAAQRQLYAERLSDRVASLDFPKDASLAVVDGEGRNIVWRGSFPMAWSAPTERLALNEGNTVTSGTVTLGGTPYLTLERRFPALNWSIRTAVPVSTITEPASRHALELVRIALFLFGVISVLGIALVTRILNPLGRISATAKRLESYRFDDAGGEGLSSLMESLPAKRRDEIGNVARAFSQMLVALDKNVRDLKASLAKQHGIEGELNAAREIQTSMLPKDDAAFHAEGFDAAAKMVAAKEVGGDLFDVIRLPGGRRALVLGDVSGKGVSAALMMSVTLTLIRNALSNGFEPAAVIKTVNDRLAANNENCMFVTLWIGIFEPDTGLLTYANGGHCPPYWLPADRGKPPQAVRNVSGPLVGVFEEAQYQGYALQLRPGDLFFVYSDGVSEAMNENRELFGEKGILAAAEARSSNDPRAFVDGMLEAVVAWRKTMPQSDDITMLAIRHTQEEE